MSSTAREIEMSSWRSTKHRKEKTMDMRMYWLVGIEKNGFQAKMLVYGTEKEMQDYLNSEIGGSDERHTGDYSYSGASASEVEFARALGIKAYIAPKML